MQSLSQFFDRLPLMPMQWDIQRNDELSSAGDGAVWQAELAPPLWTADVTVQPVRLTQAQEVAARVRGLHGAQTPFLFRDPFICGPKLDPKGVVLGAASVTVGSKSGKTISLAGLPAGYPLSVGDKLQVTMSTGKTAFVEVSEPVTASGGGSTGLFPVFPNPPVALASGNAVTLKWPACPCIIVSKSFKPGTTSGNIVSGIGFSIIQKRGA